MEEGRNGGAEWVRVGWWVCYLFYIWFVIGVSRLVGMGILGMFIVDAVCSLGSSRDASAKLYLVTA